MSRRCCIRRGMYTKTLRRISDEIITRFRVFRNSMRNGIFQRKTSLACKELGQSTKHFDPVAPPNTWSAHHCATHPARYTHASSPVHSSCSRNPPRRTCRARYMHPLGICSWCGTISGYCVGSCWGGDRDRTGCVKHCNNSWSREALRRCALSSHMKSSLPKIAQAQQQSLC